MSNCENNSDHGDYCNNCFTCHDCLAEDDTKSKEARDSLTQQVAELREALLSIKNRQQVLTPSGFEFSSVWQMADKALKEGE
jgi:polyferredoxin